MVDPDHPDAWKNSDVVEYVRNKQRHAIVVVGEQITFLPAHGVEKPEKIVLEWDL